MSHMLISAVILWKEIPFIRSTQNNNFYLTEKHNTTDWIDITDIESILGIGKTIQLTR